jgi:hypothetical protein
MTSSTEMARIEQALNETRLLLLKEKSYMVQHQKAETIALYRARIAKLNAELDALLA